MFPLDDVIVSHDKMGQHLKAQKNVLNFKANTIHLIWCRCNCRLQNVAILFEPQFVDAKASF